MSNTLFQLSLCVAIPTTLITIVHGIDLTVQVLRDWRTN